MHRLFQRSVSIVSPTWARLSTTFERLSSIHDSEIRPDLVARYKNYGHPKVVVDRHDFFFESLRCQKQHLVFLLNQLERARIAVDDGSPLPWFSVPRTVRDFRIIMNVPPTIEINGWHVILSSYSYDPTEAKGGMGAIIVDCQKGLHRNCNHETVCEKSSTRDVLIGEGEALVAALSLALSNGAKKVHCFCDSEVLFDILARGGDIPEDHIAIVFKIFGLLRMFPSKRIHFVSREQNQVADWLSRRGREIGHFDPTTAKLKDKDVYYRLVNAFLDAFSEQEPCIALRFREPLPSQGNRRSKAWKWGGG